MPRDDSTTTIASHSHRWRIGEPEGPESIGTCSICGTSKIFKNWYTEPEYVTKSERRQRVA